jgi:tetratricopeptide (TPR) repeat protein
MVISKSSCTAGIFVLLALLPGCSELRGRRHAREGNRLFEAGNYEQAVAEYDEAERLRPGLPQVALNKGLACRQLLGPGVPRPETERAASCALAAFQHLKELRPNDPRADQLYVQTLFDADRYETLAAMYQKQLAERPNDRAALDGLVQVYSRWDRWEDALRWIIKRADSDPSDAAAQYSVGAFVWDVLFRKGGSAEKNQFDPRAGAADGGVAAPLFGINDIVGQRRVQLAETGIAYLQKALQLRAGYREALTYLNLLYRQKSFAYFNDPAAWQAAVDKAESYRKQAVEQATAAPGASR